MNTIASTKFFIAVPGDDQASGIFGIGMSPDAALQDVKEATGWSEPTVTYEEPDTGELRHAGRWTVTTDTGEDRDFHFESDAREYAAQKGFVTRECTERLYRHVEAHGCDASTFRWTVNSAGLDDLYAEAA